MNFIIVDLEATCWEERREGQNEIIEIGAVMINEAKETVGEFQCFVKPLKHPILSDFCKELTTITQQEVDNAPRFDVAVQQFKDWFKTKNEAYLLCSWGFYDRNQFEHECKQWGLETDWLKHHISLKHQYGPMTKLRRNVGMKRALVHEGIPMDGTHHRGIDDARNISKIFLKHFGKWKY